MGEVIKAHGYPPIHTGPDLVALQQTLFVFLYDEDPGTGGSAR